LSRLFFAKTGIRWRMVGIVPEYTWKPRWNWLFILLGYSHGHKYVSCLSSVVTYISHKIIGCYVQWHLHCTCLCLVSQYK
jgi:hypothetical protein